MCRRVRACKDLIRCCARTPRLLTGVTHFNYRSNIIELVIPRMNDDRHPDVANLCCETITQLFRNDKQFDATQETVKAMSRVIKAR